MELVQSRQEPESEEAATGRESHPRRLPAVGVDGSRILCLLGIGQRTKIALQLTLENWVSSASAGAMPRFSHICVVRAGHEEPAKMRVPRILRRRMREGRRVWVRVAGSFYLRAAAKGKIELGAGGRGRGWLSRQTGSGQLKSGGLDSAAAIISRMRHEFVLYLSDPDQLRSYRNFQLHRAEHCDPAMLLVPL